MSPTTPKKAKASTSKTSGGPKRRGSSTSGLRGVCRVRFDRNRLELGGIAASLVENVAGGSDTVAFELLLTDTRQRVTYAPKTDKAFTIVYRGAEGIDFWDDATRSVVSVTGSDLPRTVIAAAKSMKTSTRENGDDELAFVVETEDIGIGRVRHELTISRQKDFAPFGPALMRVLHCGPACHAQSGLPWEEIAKTGLIVRERTSADKGNQPISELDLESLELMEVSDQDFMPPRGYQPLEELIKKSGSAEPSPPHPEDPTRAREIQVGVIKQALEDGAGSSTRALLFEQALSPDCLGSTRFGGVTASLHQDLFTVASNAINTVAPLLGPTTIGGGIWRVPWLANLAAVNAANPNAPGSGLFCLLRQPRVPTSPPGPTGGGTGLLDRLAFRSLYERDSAGLVRTQREFTAGTLPTTLATWGVGGPTNANLLAASGDLNMVSLSDQRVITDGYETGELGVFTIGGLPAAGGPFPFGSMTILGFTTPPLFTIGFTGLTGTVNFASLGGGPLVTAATIGSSGDVVLGLMLPTITLAATVTRSLTGFGGFVLTVGTLGFCFAFPPFCPLAVTLAVLAAFVLNNVTAVRATATGVSWTFDVSFAFDPTTERVEPFATLLARTGVITVATFGPTPNIIANAVDALIAAFGNLFDVWGAVLAGQATTAIQKALREQGLELPVAGRQNELRAVNGTAVSSTGSILQLSADVQPIAGLPNQPFTTQVITSNLMRQQLLVAHLNIRRDLNPQVPPPPGPGPRVVVGTFAGLGLSQNALNDYVFQQWIQHQFEVTVTDPATIASFVAAAPQLFVRFPNRIHIWPATAPRIEIATHEIALGTRPLVVFFDDVRACFELPNSAGGDGQFSGLWELSCNFKSSATIELAWPWVFGLRVDPIRSFGGAYEPRTWEFVDPNVPAIMGTVGPQDLSKLVDLIGEITVAPISAVGLNAPATVRPWTRPLPAMQQEVFPAVVTPGGAISPQQVYLEFFARRKALYVLPAIDTALLELFDGSGAPTLNFFLSLAGAPGPLPTTVLAMRCKQGAALRDLLLPRINIPAGP